MQWYKYPSEGVLRYAEWNTFNASKDEVIFEIGAGCTRTLFVHDYTVFARSPTIPERSRFRLARAL